MKQIFPGQELEEKDPIEALGETIPGTPGEDYPIFSTPPDSSFLCDGKIQVCMVSHSENNEWGVKNKIEKQVFSKVIFLFEHWRQDE